ncbi:MAG: hypothetical protein ACI4L6_02395 [Candidatus Onthoplasma sp.]
MKKQINNIFTLKNISEFLKTKGYYWTGSKYSISMENEEPATINDFNEKTILVVKNQSYKDYLPVFVSNLEFLIDERMFMNKNTINYSTEWREFLRELYPDYDSIAQQICNNKKSAARRVYYNKCRSLEHEQEKINDEFTQKENYYNSILDEIKNSKTRTL